MSNVGPLLVVMALLAIGVSTGSAPAARADDLAPSVVAGASVGSVPPPVAPQPVSADPYTDAAAQHRTEVETHTVAHGSDVVSVFQVGRFNSGGSAGNIGWATSHDGGATWTRGFFQGLVTSAGGPYPRVVNQSVSYDEQHGTWVVGMLGVGLVGSTYNELAMFVYRSTDGENWASPVTVVQTGQPDKAWVTCDNTPASPYFGTCYALWSTQTTSPTLRLQSSRSLDGGLTWSSPVATAGNGTGYDVQPVVQPDGTVVVVGTSYPGGRIIAFRSTDGGTTYSAPVTVATIQSHTPKLLRYFVKPSAVVGGTGVVYAAWADCRFRAACAANDIVLSRSSDGVTWGAPERIALDDPAGPVDHFLPGLGVQPAADGQDVLGLMYYNYPLTACGGSGQPTCLLNVSFSRSDGAAQTWSAPLQVNPVPMSTTWLPTAYKGRMVGDYFSTAFSQGNAVFVYAQAKAPTGSVFDEAMQGAVVGGNTLSVGDATVLEGNPGSSRQLQFTVGLGAPLDHDVTANFATVDGTADASDYAAGAGSLVIPAGQQAVSVVVPTRPDLATEPNEQMSLALSNVAGTVAIRTTATGTIVSDDANPSVSVGDVQQVLPAAGQPAAAVFPVRVIGTPAGPVTVNYTTKNSTALAPRDYTTTSGTLTIPTGASTATIPVPVAGTDQQHATRTFTLTLSTPTGGITIADSTATATLVPATGTDNLGIDDTGTAEGDTGSQVVNVPVQLSAPTDLDVTFRYTLGNGTATAGTDYTAATATLTIPAGSTTTTVPVTILGDTTTELNETVLITLSSTTNSVLADATATLTILNDDGQPATAPPTSVSVGNVQQVLPAAGQPGAAAFPVRVVGTPAGAVTVNYTTKNSTALAPRDYTTTSGTLTIPTGASTATIPVPVAGTDQQHATRTFTLTLSTPTGGITIADSTATATLVPATGTDNLGIDDTGTAEGDTGSQVVNVPVQLSAPTDLDVTFRYTLGNGTATAGTDYTAATATLTIPAGSTTTTVPVTILGDTTTELNETVLITLSSTTNSVLADATATLTILNDD